MDDLVSQIRREIQATERRLRTCMLTSIGVAVLIILAVLLALTSLLLTHPH
jgi:predicted nucleic acid-binding Zn ribbon protein